MSVDDKLHDILLDYVSESTNSAVRSLIYDAVSDYCMEILIQKMSDKIKEYWNKNNISGINKENKWELFRHCCCMSLDDDVDEYINCLEAMKEKESK